MKASEIRDKFLEFYRQRQHRIFRSAPLLPPPEDPTLLFTSAGMVPFKKYWVMENPELRRAASVQKCLRATDLEDVGRTPRHCTFFEMLGHFSFGDYFKREAITWNWELFRDVLGIPQERMRVSVYEEDDEAFAIWRDEVGLPEDWIFRLGKEDNFWGPAGETGPCGPSSEVYYDLGPDMGCGRPDCGPGCDCDRWVEIGNFVFPQYDMQEDGTLAPLRNRGIDTGIGLERLAMVLQGQRTIFATDLFAPIVERIEELVGRPYAENPVAMNIVADHVRALTFAFTEGIMPGNEGRGYVLRRILRRAALQGYLLGREEPFLDELASVVVEIMSGAYPELREALDRVRMALRGEEERFRETLAAGVNRFQRVVEQCRAQGRRELSGEEIFLLYDTYGFPLDLVRDMAQREGLGLDGEGFRRHMERQREISRRASVFAGRGDERDWDWVVLREGPHSRFVGYETLEAETRIVRYAPDPEREGEFWVVLEETPFYAEAGGQVGDTGWLEGEGFQAEVLDTQRLTEGIGHRVRLREGTLGPEKVRAVVDGSRRADVARNHTATHLLHAALRRVLGEHVTQAGSLVAPDRLRFDFTHYGRVEPEQLREVDRLVNEAILRNEPVQVRWSAYEEALRDGVIALFGEKYDEERVRRIEVGDFSRELCGGTHVRATGDIGHFVIVEESAVSAGIRRIEAVTGRGAVALRQRMQEILGSLRRELQAAPEEIPEKVRRLREELSRVRKELQRALEGGPGSPVEALLASAQEVDGHRFVVGRAEAASVDLLRKMGDRLAEGLRSGVGVVLARVGAKESFLAVVTPDLVKEKGLRADEIVRKVAGVTGGRGGGNPRLALAGVGDPAKVEEALEVARRHLREILAAS
jgi:alanyl-tRNA synthetase